MKNETKAALLLTPIFLATSPIMVGAGESMSTYSHQSQDQVFEGNEKGNLWATNTIGGTQTYDIFGKPWDNDSDTDESGF
jgi:hypothetical protein